jgi:MHS family proline/betaine transporter-like MFS transporter
MMALTVATMALILPAHNLMMDGTLRQFLWGQVLMAVPLGMALGLQGAMVVEIFPLRSRVTSHERGVQLTLALAGGTAPLVATWLIDTMKQPLAPAYYVFLYGLLGLAIMWPMKETNTRRLDQ